MPILIFTRFARSLILYVQAMQCISGMLCQKYTQVDSRIVRCHSIYNELSIILQNTYSLQLYIQSCLSFARKFFSFPQQILIEHVHNVMIKYQRILFHMLCLLDILSLSGFTMLQVHCYFISDCYNTCISIDKHLCQSVNST